MLLKDPNARILALYPARALIQDQIDKWERALEGTPFRLTFIDGSVATDQRGERLHNNHVILMTPDVAHAWMMSNLRQREIAVFTRALRLLILDEAHVYEGVFGTNMAYFLRRLDVVTAPHRLLCSTATLGRPSDFVLQLTGRETVSIDQSQDGSPAPNRHVLLARDAGFEQLVELLKRLSQSDEGRFLAFSDSRKMVERVVSATLRSDQSSSSPDSDDAEQDVEDDGPPFHKASGSPRILPFRAGYESEDARAIQSALLRGHLGGVVSTSALELGLDIGEIDLAILLNLPPSQKGFWQRLGRAGRKRTGICLMIDSKGAMSGRRGSLAEYIERSLEPSWLYLENKYLQYANALCAALELSELGMNRGDQDPFKSLPKLFAQLLENELNPTEMVPSDLYPLKQRAQAGPHREFPLRSGIEQDFKIQTPQGISLGNVTFSQLLREAYPGAIYYYVARPYRIGQIDIRNGRISARRERHWTTTPLANTMVFPRFSGGILALYGTSEGFLVEAELQVSERVTGFQERRGSATPQQFVYGPSSPFYRRDLNRFFQTTGVCWRFLDKFAVSEETGSRIVQAFSMDFGVQERDLGLGLFHSKQTPFGAGTCQGLCIYDGVSGSLRLTQRLAENFGGVVAAAAAYARAEGHKDVSRQLESLERLVRELRAVNLSDTVEPDPSKSRWTKVIVPGSRAIYMTDDGPLEVCVREYRYTPKGLVYELDPLPTMSEGKWMVVGSALQPMHGYTKLIDVDFMTGETRAEETGAASSLG
jgi:DEAD/DEAH box helicase domain-containing protein